MSSHCHAVIVLCCLVHVAIGVASNIHYNVSTILDASYGEQLGTTIARSLLDCTRLCSKTTSCQSAMFNIEDSQCTTNRWNIDPTAIIPCDPGGDCEASSVRKYATKYVKTTMQQPCLHAYDCVDPVSECRRGVCACVPGYSFHRTSYSCVTECTLYGKTFQMVRDKKLNGFNDEAFRALSLEHCTDTCLASTTFVCRSMEFYPNNTENNCYLSKITAVTHSEVYVYDTGAELYTRDCF